MTPGKMSVSPLKRRFADDGTAGVFAAYKSGSAHGCADLRSRGLLGCAPEHQDHVKLSYV